MESRSSTTLSIRRSLRQISLMVLALLGFSIAGVPVSEARNTSVAANPHAGHLSAAPLAASAPSSLSFNGTNSYVRVADAAGLRIPNNLTIEAWIKPTAVPNGHKHIVGKNNWELSVEASGSGVKVLFEFSSGGNWRTLTSGQIALNQWYHVAGVYDGSNMRLFVNGSRVASMLTSGNIDQTANPLRIASADASGDFFKGLIDEVRLSSGIRYTGNFVPPQAPLTTDASTRGLWHLDEGSGTTTADSSANAFNGTLVNAPVWSTDSPFTGPDTTPPVISAVATSNLSSTGATISWTTSEGATSQIEYGTTAAYGSSTALDAALVTAHSQTLTGLTPNTQYNYRVISKDAAGNQSASANATFTTLTTDPPAAPIISGIGAASITTSSATIGWVTDVPADSQVEYGTTTAYGSSTTLNAAQVTAHSQTISGLVASTTYHYRVKSRGANGVLAMSGDGVFVTGNNSAAQVGQWSPVMNWPLVAVHTVQLPTGNVLLWDAWELAPNVQARIWNPTSQSFVGVTNQFSSIFCSGQAMLADGRQLVIGGFSTAENGIKDTNIFNPATNSWTRVADMAYARWYPTATTLSDGRVLALGGQITPGVFADVPEIYNPTTNTWSSLTTARRNVGEYPFIYVLPNGRIAMVAGPDYQTRTLDVATQSWSLIGEAPIPTGTAAMYRPGKIMTSGGGTPNVDPVQRDTAVIDMNQPSPSWRVTASMANPRFQHNLIVLPDGNVLAVGGSTQYSLVSTSGVRAAELWNATTETWSTMASMQDLRMYHSTGILLPDGRVLVAGGGRAAPAVDYPTAEIYSPPYLFKGARPTITSAPSSVTYGATMTIDTPDAATIASAALVRLPSVTHTVNMDQRYIPLSFTASGSGLNIVAPGDGNVAPPGYYMLFIVNGNGIPSVARIVQIGGAVQADTQPPTVSLSAPTSGASVSGNVTISASAADNVGVAGVQFLLDGTPLGPIDASAPYSITWNSTTATNGAHTLGAQARDSAGNLSTASAISVTVANSTSDTTPPIISAIAASAQSTTATITWTTSEPSTSRVEYGLTDSYTSQTAIDPALVTTHSVSLSGLSPSTLYHYRVVSDDAAGNSALSSDRTFTTSAPAPITLLGETTVRANQDNNAAGMAEAFQYTATASGNVNTLSIYLDGNNTASQVVVGLYANTRDDNPGILLTQATITSPTRSAWNTVTVPSASVTSGGKYWIAVLGPLGGGTVQFRDVASGSKAQTSVQSNLSSLPSTWTPGATYFNAPMSAYAVQAP